jgi:hypothetical protein
MGQGTAAAAAAPAAAEAAEAGTQGQGLEELARNVEVAV